MRIRNRHSFLTKDCQIFQIQRTNRSLVERLRNDLIWKISESFNKRTFSLWLKFSATDLLMINLTTCSTKVPQHMSQWTVMKKQLRDYFQWTYPDSCCDHWNCTGRNEIRKHLFWNLRRKFWIWNVIDGTRIYSLFRWLTRIRIYHLDDSSNNDEINTNPI